jgi:hypothetical protein
MIFQETPPDYSIRNIRHRFSSNNADTIVEFEVENAGGAASEPATVELAVITTGEVIDTDTLAPLPAQGRFTVTFVFPTSTFPPGSTQRLRAAVGVDEIEASNSQNIQNNYAQISVEFPEVVAPTQTEEPPTPVPQVPASPLDEILLRLNIDRSNPTQTAVVVGIGAAVIILLLLIILILRLLFQRPPEFGSWQPPYANMTPVDPNTTIGKRQQWQQFAQNATLPPSCVDGSAQARKLLIGVDGGNLAGWRVKAIRMSQYDMYGRVARSQILASNRSVKRLSGAVRKSGNLDAARIQRRVRPIAKDLVGRFQKKLSARNSMLPIALDIRLEGTHGDVRIVFELYQCRYGQWQKLDNWEPEMTVLGKTIHESYTFNLHGLSPGETVPDFRRRLMDNLTQVLTAMIQGGPAQAAPPDTPTSPGQPKVDIGTY